MKSAENRLVDTSIKILCVISTGELSVNSIIKQTSSDRSYVLEVMKGLKDAELVSEYKDPGHKQRKIMKATRLGLELIKLNHDIEQYKKAYTKFLKAAKDNFKKNSSLAGLKIVNDEDVKIVSETTRIFPKYNKLKAIGWKVDEIKSFSKWDQGITFLERSSLKNVLLCLILKYLLIHFGYNPNDKAEKLFTKIIIDEIARQLSLNKPNGKTKSYRTPNINLPETVVYLEYLGMFNSIIADVNRIYVYGYNLSSCRYMENETSNLLRSLLSLINTNGNPLKIMLRPELQYLENVKLNAIADKNKLMLKDYDELISLYRGISA